jgi:hypothetical protein
MPTQITSSGITFTDTTTLTSANIGTAQLVNGSVTAEKLGTTEQRQIAKAWVNFDGTLSTPITPRTQYNVSSVTKNGTGNYTVNFATPMSDSAYSITGSAARSGISAAAGAGVDVTADDIQTARTQSAFRVVVTRNNGDGTWDTTIDSSQIGIQIFGN